MIGNFEKSIDDHIKLIEGKIIDARNEDVLHECDCDSCDRNSGALEGERKYWEDFIKENQQLIKRLQQHKQLHIKELQAVTN